MGAVVAGRGLMGPWRNWRMGLERLLPVTIRFSERLLLQKLNKLSGDFFYLEIIHYFVIGVGVFVEF